MAYQFQKNSKFVKPPRVVEPERPNTTAESPHTSP